MTYIAQASLVVSGFALLMWLGYRATESDRPARWFAACAVLVTLGLALLIKVATDKENSGPCVRYETRVIANGKTVQPYRVCVERGEWIDTKETR